MMNQGNKASSKDNNNTSATKLKVTKLSNLAGKKFKIAVFRNLTNYKKTQKYNSTK